MSNDYSENKLVQESACQLLYEELGWDVVTAHTSEKLGQDGTLGRYSFREVLLRKYLANKLKALNAWLSDAQVQKAIETLDQRLSSKSALQINEEKYALIRDGIPVVVPGKNGKSETRRARVIDFDNPTNNYFLAVKEFQVQGDVYTKRADIVGFVNGIPLLFIELKKHTVEVQNAYYDNYVDYQNTVPHLFYYNAFVVLSNGVEAKIGTLGSKFEFFHEWKRLAEQDQGSVALETTLRGVCKKENFLDLLENFILYDHSGGRATKILARNHQYLGVNQAVEAYANRALNGGKLGVFWHTQGSGKSYSMAFLAQKIKRKFSGSPTIVVLTDRDELNKQISETFQNCGLLGDAKCAQYAPENGEQLVQLLKANPSFIFTLIQKFNRDDLEPIIPKYDVIIMSDEAHRSQYGIFAGNMMKLLPTAARIGFTGTPLFKDDNITERTFGKYVSVYDFKRAVEDGATVPLYYENRGERIRDLKNPEITDRILDAIDAAELDPERRDKLEQEFKKEIHLLVAEPRLRAIARDFVKHYSDLWTSGKAMFVCLNKVSCVRMYDYVQEYWQEKIKELEAQRQGMTQQEALELDRKIVWMKETEMAVVVSPDQNEAATFKEWGLDIMPHRVKMAKRELDKEFKDPENPFRVVFVCAMWLTGFDVKCLSCLYLDKPMKAHSLMQAIARANRVSEGKSNGLIVDYVGIVKALRKALAEYTLNVAGMDGADPTIDKEELIKLILERLTLVKAFLLERGFELQTLVDAVGFAKLKLLQDAANAVCEPIAARKTFCAYASDLARLVKYADGEDLTDAQRDEARAIAAIRDELYEKRKHVDVTKLMAEINSIINDYVTIDEPELAATPARRFDISQINFELLQREFEKVRSKNLLIKDLEDIIEQNLDDMLSVNPNRADYYARYRQIIEEYNAEQDRATIEKTFMELMALAGTLTEERQRYVREGFQSDEELSFYDMLFRDDLSKADIKKIKEVASELLQKVKEKIAEFDHWFEKDDTKAAVQNLIKRILYFGLPESYDDRAFEECRRKIYEYVCSHYREAA